ncbi:hypothetical protein [Galbibacter pacificus]|uniref:Transmembrane protein n=1 Tax=Galbibacter pacificus TaxID=2996052 RepID=A0ABT6FPQ2_9FLAO|nr:hypothetical protein [Galbibacter pacificus]MDG3582282.1 hypothetical protein [Galbibacter pacificus]MDG3585242.1 hypothetical protein [Galbibacter pacificus]
MNFTINNRISVYGGIITFSITGIGVFLVGNVSGYEAKQLIAASLQGINMLCNTIVLASATILALILTLLGVSSTGTKSKLKKEHYRQVIIIAKFDTVLFVSALVLFQFFNIPITETDNVPAIWYKYVYWTTLFFSSFLSGFMVSVVLMLYATIKNIIDIVGLNKDHRLLYKEDDDK